MGKIFLLLLLPLFLGVPVVMGANYPENRSPLGAVHYLPLPLGSVRAQGWLLTQLQLQRDGLTGHLPELMPEVGPTSAWLGGSGENWERGPYYARGLLALAYTLDDAPLKTAAQQWVDGALNSQDDSGFFGPKSNDAWWSRMLMTHTLREFADASGDPRVVPFLTKYYANMLRQLPGRPLVEWSKSRVGDEIESVIWLYNRTGDAFLLDLLALLHRQGYDWTAIFQHNDWTNDFQPRHNVNVPQALKTPALWYLVSHAGTDFEAMRIGLTHLDRDHGTAFGINTGTEALSGRSTTQGIETCSIVEKMLSDEVAMRILADPAIGDNLERLAFNALPAAASKNFKQHVYYTLPNNLRVTPGRLGFNQDYVDGGIMPGVATGFPCCIYNLHMGWPKFTQNSWAATSDNGLAIMTYAPSVVTARVGNGVTATIHETTDYPFNPQITLAVTLPAAANFPLELRIPGWCTAATVSVNEQPVPGATPGTFLRIARTWQSGDTVSIRFPMSTRLEAGLAGSVSVLRGPLLYSLQIPETWTVKTARPNGFDTFEVTTSAAWNYGLVVGPDVNASFAVTESAMPANPFLPESTPVRLTTMAKALPQWTLAWNGRVAFDPPLSPVSSASETQPITLAPVGSQMLRVTNFPRIGPPPAPAKRLAPDFAASGLSEWIPYGNHWHIEQGALRAGANRMNTPKAAVGGKVVQSTALMADFSYEADVKCGPGGEAGLIFRVSNPGIGTNAFSGYHVGIHPATGKIVLGRANGDWVQLAASEATINAGQTYHLKVVAQGSVIKVYLDNLAAPVISVTDSSYSSGFVGVRQVFDDPKQIDATFSNIVVSAL